MEITVKNPASRIILEKVDNGVIFYEVGDDNVVTSKVVYEMYFKNGILDFENMAIFFGEVLESLKIPFEEPETNRKLTIVISKINPEKPVPGESEDENEDND